MKRLWAIIEVLLSIPFLTLGLLFLIAAISAPSRALVALFLIAIGVVLAVSGLKQLRRLADISPEALKTEAVELARRLGGELTVSQFRAEYRIPEEKAIDILEELVTRGTCKKEARAERVVYVFTELQPSLAEKVCPYCGTKLAVRSALRKCPNCGAQLEISKT
jgi:hypothetical protein